MQSRGTILAVLLCVSLAGPARALIGDPAPPNPCPAPNNGSFSGRGLGVLNVTSDGTYPVCGGVYAETAITCTVKEKAGTVDIAVEYYAGTGGAALSGALAVGVNTFCAVPAGTTMTFRTAAMPPPWGNSGVVIATGAMAYGSARVLATSRKLQCSAVLVDLSNVCPPGLMPVPTGAKNLTVLHLPRQKGD